jgi:hypothetical protein
MLTLPEWIMPLWLEFAPIIHRKKTRHKVEILVVGAILATGKRTGSAVLRVMGLSEEPNYVKYHQVLNRAVWSSLAAGAVLLRLLLKAFIQTNQWLVFGIDETIERRRGERINAKGIYRDPVRSSKQHFVKANGLRWVSLMLLTPYGGKIGARLNSSRSTGIIMQNSTENIAALHTPALEIMVSGTGHC